jgi:hypothetical protein
MAEYQSQISIWDVVNQEEIETGGTGGYAEPAVRPPDQEDLGDDGGGTAGVGAPDDQQRPSSRRPPPIGPTRPVVARSSLSTVDPADYATVNNGGGTLVDPVHVYDYEATKESTDEKTGIVTPARPARSLTVRQSDVAKHYRDVVEAAINRGEKANVKASEEAIAAARLWYQTAQDNAKRIQKTYNKKYPEANLTLLEVAGVIAAVSPRQRWDQNLISAEKVIDAYLGRKTASLANLKDETGAGLRENVEIALKILDTHADPDVMSGLKRKSFWNNLMDPQGNDFDVTIDGWMASAIWRMGGTFSDGTPVDEKALAWIDHTTKRDGVQVIDGAGYIILADAVRDVARDLNLLPHEVQAIYWVAVGGGQTNTQMWSDEPKRTGPLPGYNSKGEATMTKWDDDTLWYRNHPKAQRYRYANFHVTYQQTDVPGTRKGWWIEDPLERSIPMKSTGNTGTGHRRWFKTKAEAIAYMDSKYPDGFPTKIFYRGANGEMLDALPTGQFEGYLDQMFVSPIHPQGIPSRRTAGFLASGDGTELDADGGEWTDPVVYDAVAIEDMAQRFRATVGPVDGILSAWEITGPHPTAGQITWCWENPDAWALTDVDQDWFAEQVSNRTL